MPTVQLVLQADWQDVWHSPQPPFLTESFRLRTVSVLTLVMNPSPFSAPEGYFSTTKVYHRFRRIESKKIPNACFIFGHFGFLLNNSANAADI